MTTVVGVRIKNTGKLFYFAPGKVWPKKGDKVIVETVRGLVMGDVIIGLKKVHDELITLELKPVIRIATHEDIEHQTSLDRFAIEAFRVCKEKIIDRNLDMKLVRVEPLFDNSKIMFYFSSNQRIDFRDLVKDLAAIFKTRIELRQIGIRDEAKIIALLGVCGRQTCCSSFLGNFEPVSIKMAKEQNLSLNPTKISGSCGKLMCCLKYEQEYYEQMQKIMPKVGNIIDTPDGKATVTEINVLMESVTAKIETEDNFIIKVYTLEQINNPDKYKSEKIDKDLSEFEMFIKRSKEDIKQAVNLKKDNTSELENETKEVHNKKNKNKFKNSQVKNSDDNIHIDDKYKKNEKNYLNKNNKKNDKHEKNEKIEISPLVNVDNFSKKVVNKAKESENKDKNQKIADVVKKHKSNRKNKIFKKGHIDVKSSVNIQNIEPEVRTTKTFASIKRQELKMAPAPIPQPIKPIVVHKTDRKRKRNKQQNNG